MSWSTSASRAMTRSAVVRSASRKASVPAWTASDTRAPRRTTSSHSSLSSSWNAFLVSGRGGPPHLSPGRRLEPVADAPDGGQQAGAGRVGLDLAAQALHVYVQCLGVAHVVGTPHLVEKGLPGENPSGVGHQRLEQLELLAGKGDLLASHGQLVAGDVEADVTDLEHLLRHRRHARVRRPAENGSHAGPQRPKAVGLGPLVVGG